MRNVRLTVMVKVYVLCMIYFGAIDLWAQEKPSTQSTTPSSPVDPVAPSSGSSGDASNYQLLEPFRGVHPRLFVDEHRLDEIKKLIQTSPKYQEMWQRFKATADAIEPPERNLDLAVRLKQRNIRTQEEYLTILVAAYRFSGDKAYFEKAKQWVDIWSAVPDSWCGDFGSGNLMYGMSLYYDWCWQDLSPDERVATSKLLIKWASLTKAFLDTSHIRYLLSNQWQIRISGIGVCALASDDNTGQAAALTNFAIREYQVMEEAQADDGVTAEGVGYGQYGLEYVMRFDDLAKKLVGVDFYKNKWWYNNGLYQVYLTTPRNSWDTKSSKAPFPVQHDIHWMNVDIGDCPRYNWYGPDYLLRGIAKETGNGYDQWLADAIDQGHLEEGDSFLNLLRYDDAIKPQSLETLPTLHHFENVGIVSARSDWSGNESLVTFTCGPYFGHQAVDHYDFDLGSGHAHPTANSFSIFGDGEWLICNPGYVQRRAEYENTLVVGDIGQLDWSVKENEWSPMALITKKLHPRVIKAESNPDFDQITGDATPSYFGLKKYVRHLLFIKPNAVLVLDDIASESEEQYKLFFHCEAAPDKGQAQPDGSYLVKGDKALLVVHPLTLDGVQATGAGFVLASRHPEHDKDIDKFCVTLIKQAKAWRNATAFTWSDSTKTPDPVSLEQKGNIWEFKVGSNSYDYDWTTDSLVKK